VGGKADCPTFALYQRASTRAKRCGHPAEYSYYQSIRIRRLHSGGRGRRFTKSPGAILGAKRPKGERHGRRESNPLTPTNIFPNGFIPYPTRSRSLSFCRISIAGVFRDSAVDLLSRLAAPRYSVAHGSDRPRRWNFNCWAMRIASPFVWIANAVEAPRKRFFQDRYKGRSVGDSSDRLEGTAAPGFTAVRQHRCRGAS
jgi:hypothetical protein